MQELPGRAPKFGSGLLAGLVDVTGYGDALDGFVPQVWHYRLAVEELGGCMERRGIGGAFEWWW